MILSVLVLKSSNCFNLQADKLKADEREGSVVEITKFSVSHKSQNINPNPKIQSSTVRKLLQRISDSFTRPLFVSEVMKPLRIEELMDQEVGKLSGGELQRVSLCLCLGKVTV